MGCLAHNALTIASSFMADLSSDDCNLRAAFTLPSSIFEVIKPASKVSSFLNFILRALKADIACSYKADLFFKIDVRLCVLPQRGGTSIALYCQS